MSADASAQPSRRADELRVCAKQADELADRILHASYGIPDERHNFRVTIEQQAQRAWDAAHWLRQLADQESAEPR